MKSIAPLGLSLAISACVPATSPYLTAPADPTVGTRGAGYVAVTAGVRNYDVIDPLDWRELNRRVTPGADSERGDSDDTARRGR
jgi:hypothetical protein